MKTKELRNHLTENLKEKVKGNGSFKIGKLKDGYIDFHNASYNEKTTPFEGWYTPI